MSTDQEYLQWLTAKDPLLAEAHRHQSAMMARFKAGRRGSQRQPPRRPGRLRGPADAPLSRRLRHEMGHAVVATVLAGAVVDSIDCRDAPEVKFSWRPGVSERVVLAVLAGGSAAERALGLRAGAYFGPFDGDAGDHDDLKSASEMLGKRVWYTSDEWQRADALAQETLDANRDFLLAAEEAVHRAGGVMTGKDFYSLPCARRYR